MVTPFLNLYPYLPSVDVAEGVQAYVEQQLEQCITLVYAALDGDLCYGLRVEFHCCFPQPH